MEKREQSNLEYWMLTKAQAMKEMTEAEKIISDVRCDIGCLQVLIEMCDHEIAEDQKDQRALNAAKGSVRTRIVIALVVIMILIFWTIVGCTTVQGIGTDINWMGKAGQEMLEHGHESMEK